VYVGYGSFSKTGGGTIYGDTDNSHVTGDIENTAASGSGHAVYAGSSKYRNTTLGAGVGISTENTGTGSGWEE
jgi:hypothetical protein